MEVSQALKTYEYAIGGLEESTQIWYLNKLRVFAKWCQDSGVALEYVNPGTVKKFMVEVKKRKNPQTGEPLSSAAIHGYARVVKQFMKWCSEDEEFSEYVKPRTVSLVAVPKVEEKVKDIFTDDQIKGFFDACKKERLQPQVQRNEAILCVLLDTGVRASELCGLKLGDVYLDTSDPYIKVMGKGRKEREIGIGKECRLTLHKFIRQQRKHGRPTDLVFLSRYHEAMTVNGLDQLLYRLRDRVDPNVEAGAHKFRHTFAVNYLLNGGDLYTLSRLMGHESVAITERYVKAMNMVLARKNHKSVLDAMK